MNADSIDVTMILASLALQTVLLGLIVWRRVYRRMPVFFAFLIWCMFSGVAATFAIHLAKPEYLLAFVLNMAIDTLFQLAILGELGKNVLRANRTDRPGKPVLILLIAIAILLLWSLTQWNTPPHDSALWLLFVRLRQSSATLRVALLLAMAWISRFKNLHWPEQELRIATGLGAMALVSLTIFILHSHFVAQSHFHLLDQIEVGSYLGALAYWVLSFA